MTSETHSENDPDILGGIGITLFEGGLCKVNILGYAEESARPECSRSLLILSLIALARELNNRGHDIAITDTRVSVDIKPNPHRN